MLSLPRDRWYIRWRRLTAPGKDRNKCAAGEALLLGVWAFSAISNYWTGRPEGQDLLIGSPVDSFMVESGRNPGGERGTL
jgi:hypothetical protein